MPREINTRFDDPVSDDVALEQIDGKEPAVATTLKNAENVYKSFLYIKKLYTGSLSSAKVLDMGNIANSEYSTITIPDGAQNLRVSNTSATDAFIKINSKEYKMQPSEIIELPIVAPNDTIVPAVGGDLLELKGEMSYILYIKSEV